MNNQKAVPSNILQLKDLDGIVTLNVKASPSYLNNNLTANGAYVGYVSQNEVYMISEASVTGKRTPSYRKVQMKDMGPVSQVKWCKAERKNYIVIVGGFGIQIFESEGCRLLFSHPLQSMDMNCSGITPITDGRNPFICVGTTIGTIIMISAKKEIAYSETLKNHTVSITDIASDFQSNQTAVTGHWCSADQLGNICLWKMNKLIHTFSFEGGANSKTLPCTSVVMRGDDIIAAFSSGMIRMFSISTQANTVEITAHAQSINALTMHPSKNLFASISDDTLVQVWTYDTTTKQVEHKSVRCIPNYLLCGVAFCGERGNTLVLVAYDCNALLVWNNQEF